MVISATPDWVVEPERPWAETLTAPLFVCNESECVRRDTRGPKRRRPNVKV